VAHLSNRGVERGIEFNDHLVSPDGLNRFLVCNELPGPTGEQYQEFEWFAIELDAATVTTKLKIAGVELEAAESNHAGVHSITWIPSLVIEPTGAWPTLTGQFQE
jgi:hypothetical protein